MLWLYLVLFSAPENRMERSRSPSVFPFFFFVLLMMIAPGGVSLCVGGIAGSRKPSQLSREAKLKHCCYSRHRGFMPDLLQHVGLRLGQGRMFAELVGLCVWVCGAGD